MIKKIAHLADLHLDTTKYHERFKETTDILIKSIENETKHLQKNEVLVTIVGDIFHNFEKYQTNEAYNIFFNFIKELSDRWIVLITIGNHDYDINNKSKLDCITPIVSNFDNNGRIIFLKHSICMPFENILFVNYSNFDDNKKPIEFDNLKRMYPNSTVIGLFHDVILGAKDFFGQNVPNHTKITNISLFDGCDMVMMGDIHKHQVIPAPIPVVYSGSLNQLNYGETVSGHGYCLWDIPSKSFEFIEISNDWGLYQMKISNFDDIDNNKELITNL